MRVLLLLLFCLLTVESPGQFVAKHVLFLNAAPYSQADLLTLEPIKPGQSFTQADLQAAAGVLADSGYFSDVQASLDGPAKGIDVRFQLVPLAQSKLFLPTFGNLVWLSAAELKEFTQSIPLLSFGIPEGGSQKDAVQTALEHQLASRSIPARIGYTVIEPESAHPRGLIEYRAESPRIIVQKAALAGVPPAMAPDVYAILRRVQNSLYDESATGNSTADMLLSPWKNNGYIDAHLDAFQRSIDPASTSQRVLVNLHATVVAGDPYQFSSFTFAGTPLESSQQFAATVRLHDGEVFSRSKLLASLQPATDAYHAQGYIDAVVNAEPTRDIAGHKIAYTITVDPGVQYRLRTVTIVGLPTSVRADFDAAFKLKAGDI